MVRGLKFVMFAGTALGSSGAVFAQQVPNAPVKTEAQATDAPQEIIVTAQFRSQNLQKTPLAITAVTGEMLAQRGLTDIKQISNSAPSVTLVQATSGLGRTTSAFIRGVGANDFNPAFDPSVGFYVDDVYYASLAGATFDLLDLERVEVLRGPQGTLFGKNTIGGAIRLISKKPSNDTSGSIEGTYGSYDRTEIRGSFNLPLIDDKLFLRASGVHKQSRGYVNRVDFACANPTLAGTLRATVTPSVGCVVGHEGGENVDAMRVALRATPTDRLDINVAADYTNDHSEPPATTALLIGPAAVLNGPTGINPTQNIPAFGIPYDNRFLPPNPYTTYSTYKNPITGQSFVPEASNKIFGIAGTIDLRVSDGLKIRSITGYRKLKMAFAYDSDASPLDLVNQYNRLNFKQFSQELQAIGSLFNGRIEWVAGLYYFHGKAFLNSITDLPVSGLYIPSTNADRVEDKSAFAHVTWHITDKLNLIGGVRYTDERKDYTLGEQFQFYLPGGTGVTVPIGNLALDTPTLKAKKWNPKVSIDYQFTPSVLGYAQFSTGFRGGGVNVRPFTPAQIFPVAPETLKAYELGLKTQWFNRALTVNVAVYDSEYHGLQATVGGIDQTGTPFSAPLNVGNARVKGVELETSLHLGRFEMGLSGDYLDAKITEGRLPGNGLLVSPASLPQKGTPLQFAPKWKLNVGAQYRFDLASAGTLTPRFDVAYQSKIYFSPQALDIASQAGYAVTNARLSWAPTPSFIVTVAVTNLFDKFYYASKFDTYTQGLGTLTGTPSRPREWSISLKKTF